MTSSVRILSVATLDSSPAILLVAPDGHKTLVNCGEGCQRIFLELAQKVSTVRRVCLTHLSHTSIGGLPGMILTSADVMAAAAVSSAKKKAGAAARNAKVSAEKDDSNNKWSDERGPLPGLDIVGPMGTQAFIHSLRHFMRREAFELRVQEEGEGLSPQDESSSPPTKKQRRKPAAAKDDFRVQPIACRHSGGKMALSYVFTTPPIQGKFLIDKAKALGIPPGPLYGQLKAGKSVTYTDPGTGEEKQVRSDEVVEPGSPGVSVAVLCYPEKQCLEQLQASPFLTTLGKNENKLTKNESPIELVVSLTSNAMFSSPESKEWRQSFSERVRHIHLNTDVPDDGDRTPFYSANVGALCRSKLCSDVYIAPSLPRDIDEPQVTASPALSMPETRPYEKAIPLLEYTIIPRARAGFSNRSEACRQFDATMAQMEGALDKSGAINVARSVSKTSSGADTPSNGESNGEIILTGTGSAVPCKHRNVSGIYLEVASRKSMLLDVGEGTIGQLLRAKQNFSPREILEGIRAVWISHPHADHHLGILRLLTERQQQLGNTKDYPVIVVAPQQMQLFLKEYESIDPSLVGSYVFLDCREISTKSTSPSTKETQAILDTLNSELGVTEIAAVPVAHCPNSFAVVVRGTPFGTVGYSGDCRPSKPFAEAASCCDLLIHEATFSDGMENDAAVKKHCTVGEALRVGAWMKANAIMLTHFSQRYPKIPPLTEMGDESRKIPIVFGFDFMKVTPATLSLAANLTPAMRLLYDADCPDDEDNSDVGASDALRVPGLFAQTELL